jgi:CubicO group peptidase (beta-lactamase class C family)
MKNVARRWLLFAAALCVGMLTARPAATQEAAKADRAGSLPAAVRARIDVVFAPLAKPGSPGCALAVYRDGAIAYERGYGLASLELGVPITPKTVFDIGSTSKQFTAFSILLLEREGKLSLDDDVRRFLPELPVYERPITVRHLLLHTSGLRDYLTLWSLAGVKTESWTTQREAVALVERQRATNFPAGEEWLYSNTGYLLLAEIVQRASGKSLKDFARERIFEPLGMAHTFYLDDHIQVVAGKATGYEPRERGGFSVDMSNFEQIGDGGVQTTVEDLLLWDRNFYAPGVGDAALVARAQQTGKLNSGKPLDYAAGLSIGSYRGLPFVRHGGSWAGYRAELLRFPSQKTSVACLCNLGSAGPSRLADRVADIVLESVLNPATADAGHSAAPGQTPSAARGSAGAPPALSEKALADYAGVYLSEELDARWVVRVADGKLTMAIGSEVIPLLAAEPDVFRGEHGLEIAFERSGAAVRGARVNAGRVRGLEFKKIN